VPPETLHLPRRNGAGTQLGRAERALCAACALHREDERSAQIVAWPAFCHSPATPLTSESIMKRDLKSRNKALRISGETLRTLGASQLVDVAGGTSNNGCTNGSTSFAPSICHFCL